MPRVTPVAHGRAQICRADKHPVHAFDGGDGVQIGQALGILNLHQQAHLRIGLVEVISDAVPARGAGQGAADPANTLGRVVQGAHQFLGLGGVFDHGHQQRLRADIQQLLDQRRVADHRANQRLAGVGRDGL